MRESLGSPGSLYDGLLDRRPRRRRGRGPQAILALLVPVVAVWGLAKLNTPDTPGVAEITVPTNELLPLRAPEIRGGLGPIEDFDGAEFADMRVTGPTFPAFVEGEIEAGQSLTAMLVAQGVPADSLNPVIASLGQIFDFRRSRVGDIFQCEMTSEGVITSLRYKRSPEIVYEARLVGDREYESRQVEVPLEIERSIVAGTIESSFFGAVTSAGESEALAREVVTIFQWDIDFSRDVLPGDGFRVLFEKVHLEGEFLRYGQVLAAEYDGARVEHGAYYFDDPEHAGYYTAEGIPLERFFLAAPCRHRRISSLFDLERWHPVLDRRVPHLGVDYAADTGTPVWASADGEVTRVGYDSRAGNIVKIRHANSYESIYAHLNGFAAGLREGQDVAQGQVIGYVGSTGMSTGPHLHYGLKRRGEYVDPLELEFSRGEALSGRALRDFQRRHSQLLTRMAEVNLPSAQGQAPEEEGSGDLLPDLDEMLQEAGHDY